MENIQTITTFLGWCTVINLGMYIFTAIMLTILKKPVKNIHSKLSGISVEKLDEVYFNYLGNYKLAIIILNIVPYIALKIMAS